MDVLSSCSGAASLLGLTSSHAFIYLARVIQETCAKVQDCTNNEVLVSVTLSRVDGPGGVLLYATGYAGLHEEVEVSPEVETQISVGVDSIVSALQQLALDRKEPPSSGVTPLYTSGISTGGNDAERDVGASGDVLGVHDSTRNELSLAGDGDVAGDQGQDDGAGATPSPDDGPRLSQGSNGVPAPTLAGGSDAPAADSDADLVRDVVAAAGAQEHPKVDAPAGGGAGQTLVKPNDRAGSLVVEDDYVLSSSFKVPGLMVPPQRILLPTGRGMARREPPARAPRTVTISSTLVNETVKELSHRGRDVSLRDRLKDFTALYKHVIDTLVKRAIPDEDARKKVNHTYPQLTPEAVRNVSVHYRTPGGSSVMLSTPMFNNSHNMKTTDTLAVILFMKHERDPFFLWVLAQFCAGAKAPPEVVARPRIDNQATAKKGIKRKRARGPGAAAAAPAASTPGGGVINPGGSRGTTDHADGNVEEGAEGAPAGSQGAATPGTTGGDNGDARAGGPRSGTSLPPREVHEHIFARSLMSGDRVVATADVHPEFSSFHSGPVPTSVVSCFLLHVEDGCSDVVYPFGQDPALCLEKGNPSATPVTLGSIQRAYKIAWPVAFIGPRMRLYDRPFNESGAILLASGLVWRAAEPAPEAAGDGRSAADERASILLNMPAVEVFDVSPVPGKEAADYPFTTAFYESAAYASYRKVHFPDLMLPCTMEDAVGVPGAAQRSFLLWDPRFASP